MSFSNLDQTMRRIRQKLPAGSLLNWLADRESRVLWIDKIMLPRHSRKGAGSILLARILEQADKAGAVVELNANPTNQPGDPGTVDLVRWYGRFGFQQLSEDQDGVQMRRHPQPIQSWKRILQGSKQASGPARHGTSGDGASAGAGVDLGDPQSFWGKAFRKLLEIDPPSFELSQSSARALYRLEGGRGDQKICIRVPRDEERAWLQHTSRTPGGGGIQVTLTMGNSAPFVLSGTSLSWGKSGVGTDFRPAEVQKLKAWMRVGLVKLEEDRMLQEIPDACTKGRPKPPRL